MLSVAEVLLDTEHLAVSGDSPKGESRRSGRSGQLRVDMQVYQVCDLWAREGSRGLYEQVALEHSRLASRREWVWSIRNNKFNTLKKQKEQATKLAWDGLHHLVWLNDLAEAGRRTGVDKLQMLMRTCSTCAHAQVSTLVVIKDINWDINTVANEDGEIIGDREVEVETQAPWLWWRPWYSFLGILQVLYL